MDESSLQRLDNFEADVYFRKQVIVTLENIRKVNAFTYVISSEHAGLLADQTWNLEQFKQKCLHSYIKREI